MIGEETIYKMLKKQRVFVTKAEIINNFAYVYHLENSANGRKIAKVKATYKFYDLSPWEVCLLTRLEKKQRKQTIEMWNAIKRLIREQIERHGVRDYDQLQEGTY